MLTESQGRAEDASDEKKGTERRTYWLLLAAGSPASLIAELLAVQTPSAYTTPALACVLLSLPMAHFLALGTASLAGAWLDGFVKAHWFRTVAWLMFIAGALDLVVKGGVESVLRPQLEEGAEFVHQLQRKERQRRFREALRQAELKNGAVSSSLPQFLEEVHAIRQAEKETASSSGLSPLEEAMQIWEATGLPATPARPSVAEGLMPAEYTWRALGKIGVGEALSGERWAEKIPFVGGVIRALRYLEVRDAVVMLRKEQAGEIELPPEAKWYARYTVGKFKDEVDFLSARGR